MKKKRRGEKKSRDHNARVRYIAEILNLRHACVNPPCGTCLTKSLSYLFESMHGTEIVPVLFSQGNLDEKAEVTSFLFQPRSRTHLCDTTKITRYEIFYLDFVLIMLDFFKWKFSDRDFSFFFFFLRKMLQELLQELLYLEISHCDRI